ncbi:FIG00469468: hypothetical protein [hydrothermal vent metagenome]|uniref:Uncharacterized protein n=1 Tax=hydrothermal vent metagenome TaxID=652676 RepID=A0A1W1BFI6_9ZZZZ
MLSNITKDRDFAKLMKQHLIEVITFLFEREQNFGILCKIEDISFNPELPEYMQESFPPVTLFILAGYTFESAYIESDHLIFEAGFGSENFGSVVSVPLLSIIQVVVDETPICINLSELKLEDLEKEEALAKSVDQKSIEASMSIFLSNPENEKFFKKDDK